ncbi:MAG: hypothetical protein ACJAT4_002926, partial [Granulosicoccus sp.]
FGEQLNGTDNLELKSNLRQVFFDHLPLQSEYKPLLITGKYTRTVTIHSPIQCLKL